MATQVTEDQERQDWLEARRRGIGGSDIAALFGLHPFKTALDVYRDKIGEGEDVAENSAIQRGRVLEPVAAVEYAARTGRSIRRQPMRRHPRYPFLLANIDRQIIAGSGEGEKVAPTTASLEIKCPGLRVFWEIRRKGLRDYMILQNQHYATVWGYDWGAFAVFNAEDWALVEFDIEADAVIKNRIIEVAGDFWEDHVLKGVPPADDAAAPDVDLPEVAGEVTYRTDDEWAGAVGDLRAAREIKAEAESVEGAAKERLIAIVGDFGVFQGAGARIYYRQKPGRKTFDTKKLVAASPLDRMKVAEVLREAGESDETIAHFMAETVLDLTTFEKQGNPYPEFRPYFLAHEEA